MNKANIDDARRERQHPIVGRRRRGRRASIGDDATMSRGGGEDEDADLRSTPLLGRGKEDSAAYGTETTDDARFYMGVERESLLNTGESGLNEDEAARRLELFGPNQLKVKEDSMWLKLALEFVQPMPMMIWAAILIESIETYIHQSMDGLVDVIVLVVLQLLNVLVGFIEEMKAGDAIAALRESLKPEATVKREGRVYLSLIHI